MKPVDEDLKKACLVSDVGQIQALLGRGGRVKGRDGDLRTPLMHVCRAKQYRQETMEAVEILLQAGADVNAKSDFWYTPLMYATKNLKHTNFRLPVIEKLILAGADVNAVDKYGYSVLARVCRDVHWDTDRQQFLKVIDLLLEAGSELEFEVKKGHTPLRLVFNANPMLSLLVFDKGANPNVSDDQGRTVLSIAREKGYDDMLKEIEISHPEVLLDEWTGQPTESFLVSP